MRQGIFAFLALVTLLNAAPARAAEEAPNCFIRISSQKEKLRFGTRLHSKAECQALARIHQRNAALDTAAHKRVDYRWKGSRVRG